MPKIPVLNAIPPGGLTAKPVIANADAFGAAFGDLSKETRQLGRVDNVVLEGVRQENNRAGNAVMRADYAESVNQTSAGQAVAQGLDGISKAVYAYASDMAKQNQAVDLANRRTGAAKESLDWYQQELQNAQGMNAAGMTERVKAKLSEIDAKYGEGLNGQSLAQFQLHRLSDYEVMTKGAAAHEATERRAEVGNQENLAVQNAIAMGAQAKDTNDIDGILGTLGSTIDSLHPGRDMAAQKQQYMTKVIDGVMRVKASAKDFGGAQAVAARYAGMNIVDPGSVATVNTLRVQAASEARAEARHAEAMARADRQDRQDKVAFAMHMAFKTDPKKFAEEYNPETVAAMVNTGGLRPAQGSALIDALTGAERHSDPIVRDEAYRLAATGDLSKDWIAKNEANLSGPDLFTITGRMDSQTGKSVEGRTLGLFVDDMFKSSLKYNRNDPEAMQGLHENQVAAQDFATKLLQEGAPLDQVKAKVRLKFDPEIGDTSQLPASRYVTAIPQSTADLQPYFDNLWGPDAKTMDKSTWKKEFQNLLSIRDITEKRTQLLNQLRQTQGVNK